jgi:hypothetical protein
MKKPITLHTLKDATAQEVFDQVATHLLTQNTKSNDDSQECLYRHNGLSCAAGCLISDDEYEQYELANFDVGGKPSSWPNVVTQKDLTDTHWQLITRLQLVHDCHEPDQWETTLRQVAKDHDLSDAIL